MEATTPQNTGPSRTMTIGIDVAKEFHWAVITAPNPISAKVEVLLSRRVDNSPNAIADLIATIQGIANDRFDEVLAGIDILGGIARLLEVMLLAAGIDTRHVPGLAVKVNRRATRGGEHKSDPRDARVIADLLRSREDLRTLEPRSSEDTALVLLVSRRRELVEYQTDRIARLRDLLCSIHPGLERVTDPRRKASLALLARYVTADEICRAGRNRMLRHLRTTGRHNASVLDRIIDAALAAAHEQRSHAVAIPGEGVAAAIVKEIANELLGLRDTITAVDDAIAKQLGQHSDAALIQTMPGMGVILTAELIAAMGNFNRFPTPSQLASAAGIAPTLQQSGKVRYLQRATSGDRTLKRVFYQSAFCALQRDPVSRAYYDRKRAEGKTHHKAVIALARRRVDVLHAILRTGQPYEPRPTRISA